MTNNVVYLLIYNVSSPYNTWIIITLSLHNCSCVTTPQDHTLITCTSGSSSTVSLLIIVLELFVSSLFVFILVVRVC